jgi:hypothetical protein
MLQSLKSRVLIIGAAPSMLSVLEKVRAERGNLFPWM